jgi:hypothetical protein
MPAAGDAMLGHRMLSGDRFLRSNPARNPARSGEVPKGPAAAPMSAPLAPNARADEPRRNQVQGDAQDTPRKPST